MNRLQSCSLALALLMPFAGAQSSVIPDAETARIEVHRGRVVLLNGGRAEQSLRRGEDTQTRGDAHIEIGTGSEVHLSWPGRASLHIWGPSSLQWSYEQPAAGSLPNSTPSLQWNLLELAWCDLEVRKGQHKVKLPGGWTAEVGPSAVYFRGLPSGPVELRLHAGQAVRVDWSGDPSKARPPVMVNPGSSVRLEPPLAAPGDDSRHAKVWDRGAAWPYRKVSDTVRQRNEREAIRTQTTLQGPWPTPRTRGEGPAASRAKVSERALPKSVQVDSDPLPTPRAKSNVPARRPSLLQNREPKPGLGKPTVVLPPVEPKPEVKPEVKPEEEPELEPEVKPEVKPEVEPEVEPQPAPEAEPAKKTTAFSAAHWGGLQRSQLESCGSFAVERGAGMEVRVFAGGRYKVLVDAHAGRPTRVFTSMGDHIMQPGSVAVFDSDGSLKMGFGNIEAQSVPKGRPAFSTLVQ